MEAKVIAVIGTLIVLIIVTTFTWEIEETETYYTSEPFTYEKTVERQSQVSKFCLPRIICSYTRVHQGIKNTDALHWTFSINVNFDDGTDIVTKTVSGVVLSGEEKIFRVDSPLRGQSEPSVNVIPAMRSVPQERTVKKRVRAWDYLR